MFFGSNNQCYSYCSRFPKPEVVLLHNSHLFTNIVPNSCCMTNDEDWSLRETYISYLLQTSAVFCPFSTAQCGGDLSGPGGVILSPNWPEWYGEGEDCSWRIHVDEDKRVLLDVQLWEWQQHSQSPKSNLQFLFQSSALSNNQNILLSVESQWGVWPPIYMSLLIISPHAEPLNLVNIKDQAALLSLCHCCYQRLCSLRWLFSIWLMN